MKYCDARALNKKDGEKKKMKNKISTMFLTMLLVLTGVFVSALAAPAYAQTTVPMPPAPTLGPKAIPKFVDQLVIPPVYVPTAYVTDPFNLSRTIPYYEVDVKEYTQQILPTVDAKGKPTGFGPTTVWSYGGLTTLGTFANSPGATFEVTRGTPIMVKWINNLNASGKMLSHLFPVDPSIHWADPNNLGMMMPPPGGFPTTPPPFPPGFPNVQTPIPIVTHLHGGEVPSGSDGGPEQWWTQNGIHGHDYNTTITTDPNAAVYYYPNEQLPTTLWYHDHALGITRINVMSGLAGFYLLRDPNDPVAASLPSGAYEVPIVIQDRSFLANDPVTGNNEFWYDAIGIDPTVHPYWVPEFFGNTIMVNGKMWPNLNVEPTTYRFRLLDGSNARFYSLFFVDRVTKAVLPFTQIGTDGGYLGAPVPLTSLTIAPGERADIIVDFSGLPVGTQILLRNNAKAPFPMGAAPQGSTLGQIMQFTVVAPTATTPAPAQLPNPWPITIPTLVPDTTPKQLTLMEVMGPNNVPAQLLLDGQAWDAPASELTRVGSTVDWIIINPTADTHPIHLHLVQFQLISRQKFDVAGYMAEWMMANTPAGGTFTLPLQQPTNNVANLAMYLKGPVMLPPPNELGWKDTIQMNPGEVTIIRVRYAPQDAPTAGPGAPVPGVNLYPFDPTLNAGPGYVWHCHILEHEDNEMMRREIVTP